MQSEIQPFVAPKKMLWTGRALSGIVIAFLLLDGQRLRALVPPRE